MNSHLDWFSAHADSLDQGDQDAEVLVAELGRRDLFRIGVPAALGGLDGDTVDATEAIARVTEKSLTAAFVFWGQRTFIEYLLQSPNVGLRERLLPTLLKGEFAGATGLSNAMKFLCGIEALQIAATPEADGWRLDGQLPWVTNLRRAGFVVAAAVAPVNGAPAKIVALHSDQPGLTRSDDLSLIALKGSNTAAIAIDGVSVGADDIIHDDACGFLPQVRPAFLGLQCGMSIGLARASLDAAQQQAGAAHAILLPQIAAAQERLTTVAAELFAGLRDGRFAGDAAPLFRLRIALAEIVQQALLLELEASGGRAYLLDQNRQFVRRWREAAFVPVVTPSLTQLQGELAKRAQVDSVAQAA